jgi:membrane protein
MFKACIPLLKETFRQWDAHRVPKMGAALSFYTVFSLAPLAILVLSLLSLAVARRSWGSLEILSARRGRK